MTEPRNVNDCCCGHIRLQHSDKDGSCMVGVMIGEKCYCEEFVQI